jgi:hypothetical protein
MKANAVLIDSAAQPGPVGGESGEDSGCFRVARSSLCSLPRPLSVCGDLSPIPWSGWYYIDRRVPTVITSARRSNLDDETIYRGKCRE